MNAKTLRVAEMAKLISVAIGGEVTEAYIARQIRNWAANGLLNWSGFRGTGSTAHRLFDHENIYRATLLSELSALGLDSEEMRPAVGLTWPAGNRPDEAKIWSAAVAGEQAFLVLHMYRGAVVTGRLSREARPMPNTLTPAVIILDLGRMFEALNEVPGHREFMTGARRAATATEDPHGWAKVFARVAQEPEPPAGKKIGTAKRLPRTRKPSK